MLRTRRRGTPSSPGSNASDGVGGDRNLLQTAILTSLVAVGLDHRYGYIGLALTLLVACRSLPIAVLVAVLHIAVVVLALNPSTDSVPSVAAGLLGGMLITPWALSAALTWAIVGTASALTLIELKLSLWYMLIPMSVVSLVLVAMVFLAHRPTKRAARKEDSPSTFSDPVDYDMFV